MRKITQSLFNGFIATMCLANLSLASIFDSELDCALMGKVSEFDGHYYAISAYPMGFEEAMILTDNTTAYISVPDSKEENEFLKSLLDLNDINAAFIGIYDKSYIANYCYSNDKCVFDDARFRTIKNKPIYFKNWADNEPNNQADTNSTAKDFSKFKGEHYVILRKDGKWADVSVERREYVIFEFDEKPSCFTQTNTRRQE